MNKVPTRETATPEQLARGEYEVEGVMGGQGRTPEELIASAYAVGLVFVCVLALAGIIAVVQAVI